MSFAQALAPLTWLDWADAELTQVQVLPQASQQVDWCVCLAVMPVHRQGLAAGQRPGTVFVPQVQVRLTGVQPNESVLEPGCVGLVRSGELRVQPAGGPPGLLHPVPLPTSSSQWARLVLTLANGSQLCAVAQGVEVAVAGDLRWVERLSC